MDIYTTFKTVLDDVDKGKKNSKKSIQKRNDKKKFNLIIIQLDLNKFLKLAIKYLKQVNLVLYFHFNVYNMC